MVSVDVVDHEVVRRRWIRTGCAVVTELYDEPDRRECARCKEFAVPYLVWRLKRKYVEAG